MHSTTPAVTHPTAEPLLRHPSPPAKDAGTGCAGSCPTPAPPILLDQHGVTHGRVQNHCRCVPLPRALRPELHHECQIKIISEGGDAATGVAKYRKQKSAWNGNLAEMGTRLKRLLRRRDGRQGTLRCFPASMLSKKTAMPFFFFLNLVWMVRGPDPPPQGVLLSTLAEPAPEGTGSAALPGSRSHPPATAGALGEKQGLLGHLSSDRSLQRFMFHFPRGWFTASSLPMPRGLSRAPTRGRARSCGVTHGELGSSFPSREEHRRGRGYPPARHGGSRGRKMGIFRWPDRAGLGPGAALLSPQPALRRQAVRKHPWRR